MEVGKIQFEILDRSEVLGMALVKITNQMNNVEFKKNNSLHDTRMGAFKNVKCGSCNANQMDCPGHFGYIELLYPVVNPSFVTTNLKWIIENFCVKCYRHDSRCSCIDDTTTQSRKRKIGKKPTHIKLNMHEAYTSRNVGIKISFSLNDNPITRLDVYKHIKMINRDDYLSLKPSWAKFTDLTDTCFIHYLPVIPTSSRPPNFSNGEWRAEHLTRLYIEIIKANNQLRMKHKVVISPLVEEYHNELQSAINILFDVNNTSKKLQLNILQNGGIRQRIDGKGGRIRMNLMGKRTEFSARSVLSGDPNLSMNEIGIPPSVARTLTVPVKVNRYNLQTILGSGGNINIRYVIKANGEKYDMSKITSFSPTIEIGDTIERSLVNGDTVVVNRQPTLHRGSILAVKVKIIQTSTFRLNYSSLVTLNGDCDGDEVNIHVPQDLQSRAELEELMMSSTNIVSSQDSKPLVGLIQDSLLGCFQLSRNEKISRIDIMDILYKMGIEDVILDQPFYKGVQIMDFALAHIGVTLCEIKIPKADFVMRDTKVISGFFNKAVLGGSDNSVIHHIYLSFGHYKAQEFIHIMQKAATAYLDMDGFSVGVGDCIVDTHEKIHHEELDKYIQEDYDKNGKLPDEEMLLEATGVVTKLEQPPDQNPDNNALLAMIMSGAKGSMMNYNQITRMVGQQVVGAGRVQPEFGESGRTLPHYKPHDLSLESRGFVKNSFIKGLSPQEFFFHAMGGRVGLIDTSCKTASTGYTFRKLVKVLERCVVENGPDGSRVVKNMATGQIIQFNYGEDNMDGTYLKRITD